MVTRSKLGTPIGNSASRDELFEDRKIVLCHYALDIPRGVFIVCVNSFVSIDSQYTGVLVTVLE